ncbi:MAG TPA: gamma carbonic anhydrase family protein [Noviherbaspirillum sp.]|nr:gamma carbonic anhydrase family protein [Noviherbaspirillum sp.]
MATYRLGQRAPQIDETAFVSAEATLIGSVQLQRDTSVWPGAVLRGDNEPIVIGAGSNVQEGAVLHADPGFALVVENNVTIGHQAMLHGCTVKEGALIGIQAVILNGAVIGRNCLVAAGAVVTEGKVFPDNSLIVGAPAKLLREMSEEGITAMHRNAAAYRERAAYYKENLVRVD